MPLCDNNFGEAIRNYYITLAHAFISSELILLLYAFAAVLLILALFFKIAREKTFTSKKLYLISLLVFCTLAFAALPVILLVRAIITCL